MSVLDSDAPMMRLYNVVIGVISQAAVAVAEEKESDQGFNERRKGSAESEVSRREGTSESMHQLVSSVAQGVGVFEKAAQALQSQAIQHEQSLDTDKEVSSKPKWNSPEALRQQQKKALGVLYGSNLLKSRARPPPLPEQPQFAHLEANRSK